MTFEDEAERLLGSSVAALRNALHWERQPLKISSDIVDQTKKIASLADKLEKALRLHPDLGANWREDYWAPEDFEETILEKLELLPDDGPISG